MPLHVDSTGNLDENRSPKSPIVPHEVYRLRLYIMGVSLHSMQALSNLKRICEQYLPERYELEVIDLERQREPVAGDGIVVAPMVVKNFPLPVSKLVGDLTNTQELLRRFDIVDA